MSELIQEELRFTKSPRVRRAGHLSSVEGSESLRLREGKQHRQLLLAYAFACDLTDEEAALRANLTNSCFWKRAGELRQAGYIAIVINDDWSEKTRVGSAGVRRIVCQITANGRDALRGTS